MARPSAAISNSQGGEEVDVPITGVGFLIFWPSLHLCLLC